MNEGGRPPKRQRSGGGAPGWDDDDRAEIGLARRRAESHALGVPVMDLPSNQVTPSDAGIIGGNPDLTSPYDLIARPLTDDQEDTARRLKRPTETPANVGQVIKAIDHTNRAVTRLEATDRRLADLIGVLENSTSVQAIGELRDVVNEQGRKIGLLVKLLVAVATAAGGSLIAVGKGLYERGAHEGADAVRLEHVESSIKDIWQDIRQRDRDPRFELAPTDHAGWLRPPASPSAPAPKDKP